MVDLKGFGMIFYTLAAPSFEITFEIVFGKQGAFWETTTQEDRKIYQQQNTTKIKQRMIEY